MVTRLAQGSSVKVGDLIGAYHQRCRVSLNHCVRLGKREASRQACRRFTRLTAFVDSGGNYLER